MDQSSIVSSNQTNDPATENERVDLLCRPVMLFVLQQHNLQHLQYSMKQALRRATCRVYAMQALNWLLRSVTQPMCLHDLLWWFTASLTPVINDSMNVNEDDNRKRCIERKKDYVSRCLFNHTYFSKKVIIEILMKKNSIRTWLECVNTL